MRVTLSRRRGPLGRTAAALPRVSAPVAVLRILAGATVVVATVVAVAVAVVLRLPVRPAVRWSARGMLAALGIRHTATVRRWPARRAAERAA